MNPEDNIKNSSMSVLDYEYMWNPDDPMMRSHISASFETMCRFIDEDQFGKTMVEDVVPSAMENKHTMQANREWHKMLFVRFLQYIDGKLNGTPKVTIHPETFVWTINSVIIMLHFTARNLCPNDAARLIPNLLVRLFEARLIHKLAIIPK